MELTEPTLVMAQQPQTQLSASSASILAYPGSTGGAFVMVALSTVPCVLIARQAADQVWGPEAIFVCASRTEHASAKAYHFLAEQGNI